MRPNPMRLWLVAVAFFALTCGSPDEDSFDRARTELRGKDREGTPPTECGLPVAAFAGQWRAAGGHHGGGLSLGEVPRRLFRLLDDLDMGTVPPAYPSLAGLTLEQQRITIAATAIAATRREGEKEDDHRGKGQDDEGREHREKTFAVNCAEVRRLAFGAPKSLLAVAQAVNSAAGSPLSAQQLAAQPFAKHALTFELAEANDDGEGLNTHGHQPVSQSSTW